MNFIRTQRLLRGSVMQNSVREDFWFLRIDRKGIEGDRPVWHVNFLGLEGIYSRFRSYRPAGYTWPFYHDFSSFL